MRRGGWQLRCVRARSILALLAIGCGEPLGSVDGALGDAARDGSITSRDARVRDAPMIRDAHDASSARGGALRFVANAEGEHEYALLTDLPDGFGTGELTLEMWLRPDSSFPVGSTAGGEDQLTNWS